MSVRLEMENEELREERDNLNRSMAQIAAERDELRAEVAAVQSRYEKQCAGTHSRISEIRIASRRGRTANRRPQLRKAHEAGRGRDA